MIAYLASPYLSADPAVREERFRAACRAAAVLFRAGHFLISPIAHSHVLVEHGLPGDWTFWQRFDRALLARCDALFVLMLDGWEESVGVQAEIRIARELGKPVRYLAPVSPPFAHVASGCREADRTPTGTDRSPTLAHVASEVPE
jgi:hypothetical protein